MARPHPHHAAEPVADALSALVDELVDAHEDTVRIACESQATGSPVDELRWQIHLDYLRALQRAGREALAHLHA